MRYDYQTMNSISLELGLRPGVKDKAEVEAESSRKVPVSCLLFSSFTLRVSSVRCATEDRKYQKVI
jgi:hypothetical protein